MPTTYCNRLDVESIMGVPALLVCIDDDQDGVESARESNYVTAAIERAATEMNTSLRHQYILENLVGNDWCRWCNAYLAVWQLWSRRGNMPPSGLVDIINTYRGQLQEIKWGRFQIPETAPAFLYTPAVSNFQPELGKFDMPIRVDLNESTGGQPNSGVKRQVAGMPGPW